MAIIQHLIVDQYGVFVGKHSERIRVTKGKEILVQAPVMHLETVTIANQGISISAEAIRECSERGIPIHFISSTGTPYASLYSSGLARTVATRRAQLEAFSSYAGLHLSLSFSLGKLRNQSNLLKYIAKYRKGTDMPLYEEIKCCIAEIEDEMIGLERIKTYPESMDGSATINDLRFEILGLEGRAAQHYWKAIGQLLPERYGFKSRIGRGATDPINSALNYGYGVLYSRCERCLVLAGLDPYAGFLHVDRPGKPSLTLDFIEEFRQPIIDRTIIALANKNAAIEIDERGMLTDDIRHQIINKVNERLDCEINFNGKRHALHSVMQMQARHLAAYLRCEAPEYIAYQMTW